VATIAHRRTAVARPKAARRTSSEPQEERPFWQVILLLYGGIFLLAVILTAVCFLSAWLAAGKPY
jgi:hypothetical protein